MQRAVLSEAEIEQFIELGYVHLKHAFSRQTAAEVRACIWKKIGLHPERSSEWTKPVAHLNANYSGAPFSDAYTPRTLGAINDLLGAGRWHDHRHLGWWPVAFPGFEGAPWQVPAE